MNPNDPNNGQQVPTPSESPLAPQPVETFQDQPAQVSPVEAVEPDQSVFDSEEDGSGLDQPTALPPIEPIQWQAAEYVQQAKQPLWYIGFFAVVIILMLVAILLMQAWTFAVLILVMAVALMVYVHRPAHELNYVLSEKGLYINDQLHPLGEFKSFGVFDDGNQHTLFLVPVKRFRPALSVYFPTEVGERVVDILGAYLPMQDVRLDAFDKIVRKLRL